MTSGLELLSMVRLTPAVLRKIRQESRKPADLLQQIRAIAPC